MTITWTSAIVRLLFAAVLGATIGVERIVRKRPAGIRTSLAVCLGSALFTLLSEVIAHLTGDASSTRIASNIVQGVGFLGAGVILRERGSVTGLTTASTIFVEAGIGMAAGAGLYAIAGSVWALLLFALIVLAWVEDRIGLKQRFMLFRVSGGSLDLVGEIHRIVSELRIELAGFHVSMAADRQVISFEADLSHRQQEKILAKLVRPGLNCEMLPVERPSE